MTELGRRRVLRSTVLGTCTFGVVALSSACHHPASVVTPVAAPVRVEPAVPAAKAPESLCTIVELEGEGRDRESVRGTFVAQAEPLRRCYAQLQGRSPAAAGVARIQLVIDPSGLAGAALMQESTVGDVTFSYCLAEAMTTISFADIGDGHAMEQTVVTCDFAVPLDQPG